MRAALAFKGALLLSAELLASSCDAKREQTLDDYCESPPENAPDSDGDRHIDACDNCLAQANVDQADRDSDGLGDTCDDDDDGDAYTDKLDDCPLIADPEQRDTDQDGFGDACDPCPKDEDAGDTDGDQIDDCADLCPLDARSALEDGDGDGIGDACDNCVAFPNAAQSDEDEDGLGDLCEERNTFSIEETTVDALHGALRSAEMTCLDVIEQTLSRIQQRDLVPDRLPPINAFVSFNLSVRKQAAELDRYFSKNNAFVGPLHCVPLVVKDNFDSSDTETSAGTLALVGTQAPDDAHAVRKLREAGAILIATTAMDELAQGVSGTSSRSGRTGNAYDPARNSGGSSAGSSAAVAASFAVLGTGTDNCSSITLPAAYHGLVALRPTYGLVSLDGVFPSNRLDAVAGPMARTVSDLALALDAMAGEDERDPRTRAAQRPTTYLKALRRDGLNDKRIGIVRAIDQGAQRRYPWSGLSTTEQKVFARAVTTMRALGATIVENVVLQDVTLKRNGGGTAELVDAYLTTVDSPRKDMLAICESELYSRYIWEDVDGCQEAYESSRERDYDSDAYRASEQRYAENRAAAQALMATLKLDALFYPVDALGAPNTNAVSSNCGLSSVTGLPALAFQVGFSEDAARLPIGGQLLGRAFSEETLLEAGYAFEQATRFRTAPNFTNRTDNAVRGPLDLREANARRIALGKAAFQRVLKDADRASALTAEMFRAITLEVLGRQGRD